ncbi:DedA family protein [Patescibacteria group bacterium]|nr:DedA family protein [Patescibacteria group bacterium]
MEVLSELFSTLLYTFEHLGVLAYWLIFLIALADSLIIVGTFTNGLIFLLLAGALISRGVYDLGDMTLFAATGAVLGGCASYYLGLLVNKSFISKRRFPKEKHLSQGADLLEQYEGAGILIGRFLGPLSSIVTFAAGVADMPLKQFLLWNVLSGLLWATVFIFAGTFIGDYIFHW